MTPPRDSAQEPAAGRWLPAVTALLLAAYFCVVVWAWASPSTDPQRGMAEGFLGLVTTLLLVLAGVRSPHTPAVARVGRLLDVRVARVDPFREGRLSARALGTRRLRTRSGEIS